MKKRILFGMMTAFSLSLMACETNTETGSEMIAMVEETVENISESNTKNENTMVIISTPFGDMKVKLYDETPLHRDNFIKLAREGFYDGLLFHRVIQGFMIQGGDPNSKNAPAGQSLGSGGPGYTIPAEFNPDLIHKKGALSAARLGDQVNPKRASSGSQFYIVQGKPLSSSELDNYTYRTGVSYTPEQKKIYEELGGTPFLDMQYTVFGEVVEGLDVIDKIAAVRTAPGDRPIEDVKFTVKVAE